MQHYWAIRHAPSSTEYDEVHLITRLSADRGSVIGSRYSQLYFGHPDVNESTRRAGPIRVSDETIAKVALFPDTCAW